MPNPYEYIDIVFEDFFPNVLYVAGHVDFDYGVNEIKRMKADQKWHNTRQKSWMMFIAQITSMKQIYARYVPFSTEKYGMQFITSDTPGRGKFKVTEFHISRWYAPISIA